MPAAMTSLDNNGSAHEVTIIDFSPMMQNMTPTSIHQVAEQLSAALKGNGCVGLRGHGIESDLLRKAFHMTQTLFGLPREDKMKAPYPDDRMPHRGYSGTGREQVAGKLAASVDSDAERKALMKTTDFKETYEIGSDESNQGNIWLPEYVLPGFRDFMTHYYWELNKFASLVMDLLIVSLDLSGVKALKIRTSFTGHDNSLRLARYPPCSPDRAEDVVSRMGPHTDWNFFTFLFQDDCGGLEFKDRTNAERYIPATPQDGVVYLSIADTFERISNGIYPSALHRVTTDTGAPDLKSMRDRCSIPYFVVPKDDGLIEPAESLVTKAGGRKFEPLTFIEYSKRQWDQINKH